MPHSARRRPRRSLAPLLVAAVLGVSVAGGCERDGERGATIGGLVVLTTGPGLAGATAYDPGGRARELAIPRATTWLSISARGDGAATLGDGTLHVAERLGRGEPGAWSRERPSEPDGRLLDAALAYPAWSPEGERIAMLVIDAGGPPTRLVIHAPATDGSLVVGLAGDAHLAPPVWIDEERLLVLRPDPDETGASVAIVDTTTGEVVDGAQGGAAVDAADDLSRLAVANVARSRLDVLPVGAWLAGGASEATIRTDQPVGQFAFDRAGTRLAAVVEGATGEPATVRVYAAADGWREISRVEIAGSALRAVVAWLP